MLYIVTGNEGIPVVIMRVSMKVFYQTNMDDANDLP